MIRVPLKRFPGGEGLELPSYQTAGSAGCDLRASVTVDLIIEPGGWALVPTGLGIALPDGYEAQVRPRSGLAVRHGITVLNAPGTIDADYRGEIQVPLINHGPKPFVVQRGERVAQLVIAAVTLAQWEEVDALAPTQRGSDGFGSTGR